MLVTKEKMERENKNANREKKIMKKEVHEIFISKEVDNCGRGGGWLMDVYKD